MHFTMQQLCARAGLKPRTVRSYIQSGLVERPKPNGAKTVYDEPTVLRATLAARLFRQGKTPMQVKRALGKLSEAELRVAVAPPGAPASSAPAAVAAMSAPREASSPAASSSKLKAAGARGALRLALLPGLELVVDDDAPEVVKRLALELTRDFRSRVAGET